MKKAGAGMLRGSITIVRPSEVSNGRGGMMQTVETIAARLPASIAIKRGGEEVQAQRLSGVTPMEITVRYDDATAQIGPGDNATNDATGETYAIQWAGCLDEGRPRWITIAAEAGTVA